MLIQLPSALKKIIVIIIVLAVILLVPLPYYQKYDAFCAPCKMAQNCPPCPTQGWHFEKPLLWQLQYIFTPNRSNRAERLYSLQVQALNMADRSPITIGKITLADIDNPYRILTFQSLNSEGKATFLMAKGTYRVELEAGYIGHEIVNLDTDKEITLEVLTVNQ